MRESSAMAYVQTYPREGRLAVTVTTLVRKEAQDAGSAEAKLAQALLPGLAQPRTIGRRARRPQGAVTMHRD